MSQKYETPQITDEEIKENCDGLNDCDSNIGKKKTRKVRKSGKSGKSGKSLRKMKRTTRKTHNKTRCSNKKKIKKINKRNKKNTRRKGGQWTDRLGINRFQLPQYKFLPDCNGTRPYIPNENWNERRDKISEKYLETYRDFNDTKKLLMDLQLIDRDVAVDLRYNCRLLTNYLRFWDKAKQKIIAWFNLGPQIKGQRRLLDFLIKMHDGEPLSPELQKLWEKVDKNRSSDNIPVPVQTMTITEYPHADEITRMPSESSPDYVNRISETPPLEANMV
jgi:hypothetical protein